MSWYYLNGHSLRPALFLLTIVGGALLGNVLPIESANADTGTVVYHVSLNTTSRQNGTYSGPFALYFQFIDGGGDGVEPNNMALLTDFSYGTGGSGPTSLPLITDGFGFSTPGSGFYVQKFTPGQGLDFNVNITTNQDTGATASPDVFSFAILQQGSFDPATGNTIATTADDGQSFFTITEPTASSPLQVTTSDALTGGFNPTVTMVSEPSPFTLLLMAGVPIGLLGWKRLLNATSHRVLSPNG